MNTPEWSMSKMQIKSDSPSHTPPKQDIMEENFSLTGGKNKKSKTKNTCEFISTMEEMEASLSAEATHASWPTDMKSVSSVQEPAPSTSQDAVGKKRKDEMEEEVLGLGLGSSKSQRRKKKKSGNIESEKSKPDYSVRPSRRLLGRPSGTLQQSEEPNLRPVHAPQAWLRPQPEQFVPRSLSFSMESPKQEFVLGSPSVSMGQPSNEWSSIKSCWQGSSQSQKIEVSQWPHLSRQPQSQFEEPMPEPRPVAGPSYLQSNREQCKESSTEYSEPILELSPKRKQTVSGSFQNACLFQIPDRYFGRIVNYKTIQVTVNYLHLDINPVKTYRYDVIIKPEKPKKFLPTAYRQVIEKYFNKIPIGFDRSKNLYSLNYLPGVPLDSRKIYSTTVKDAEDVAVFEVSFKFTGVVDLTTIFRYMKDGTSLHPPSEAIQAIDVILQQGTLESYVKIGRQFFKRPRLAIDLGEGQEMWTGLFQSAIFTDRPYINVDVAHKGFPKPQLLLEAFIRDFHLDPSRNIDQQTGKDSEAFLDFIKNLKVVAFIGGDTHNGEKREFICNGLVEPPGRKTFQMQSGTQETEITVADYFEKVKGCRVRYPNLNCVWVGSKKKTIYYPMEFLRIANTQFTSKQLSEAQISKMIKTSSTQPCQRKKKIEDVIINMNYSKNLFFKKFGLDIGNQLVSVPAKILQPPRIDIGGAVVDTKNGQWNAKKVLKPQTIERWAFISIESDYKKYDNFINMLLDIANNMGLRMKQPIMKKFNINIRETFQYLQRARDLNVSIMVIAITTRGRDYYAKVKSIAEREVGIVTQCVMEHTVSTKMTANMMRNIIFKINAKLMGINHALDSRSVPLCLQNDKVMLVGADVTHPASHQKSMPSIAAVTASMDNRYCSYNIAMSVQAPKMEVILDFENLLLEHLTEYEKRHKALPTKIFVFRDGVSDGQFAQVMNSELQAVHNAYARKTGPNGNRPEVLFLVVQKRHHTRFFLGDSSFNVSSGTVVDSKIVHPRELDFYLISHWTSKGTVRPTRYHVVCNDGRLSQDEVEQMVFYLCHLCARCQHALSYPTPTYYAHLACLRARSLVVGEKYSMIDLKKNPQRLRVSEKMSDFSMFYI